MLIDIHDDDYSGITLYIFEGLSEKAAERLADAICEEAKKRMKRKFREYKYHLKWKQFFNYCKQESP